MIAFLNKEAVKTKYLKRLRAHAAADEIIKGTYWQGGKGCAVGCTIHGSSHSAYETELGIPRIIARLEDGIFEGLPNGQAKKFPLQFLEAINVGADLSNVWPEFAVWLLVDKKHGVIQFAKTENQREAIKRVAELYQLQLDGEKVSLKEWQSARSAAVAAAAAAAYAAAAYAAAAYAAAAAAAAAYAAYAAAAYAAAAKSSKEKARIAQRNKLLQLLRKAK